MSDSTPICRCRVLYLGSSVPQVTKDGLQGIQEPLQELYPEQGAIGARGIDSWLSVWSNGILLENVDENHKKITRFFPIDSLHYCAAIRYVLVPEKNTLHTPTPRFLPLDSPFARAPNPAHPPLFAAILRRTTGIKVLECHAFICKREVAANALVRCCFHAYADSSYAKQVEGSVYGTLNGDRETKEKVEDWKMGSRSQSGSTMTINTVGNTKDDISIYNGDENHKVWAGSQDNLDAIYDVYSTSTLSRPQRPRQVAQPVAVPPPPAPKEKPKKSKSKKSSSKEDIYMNGYGKANSISGTMMHPKNRGHLQGPHQPLYIMSPHHGHPMNASTTLPNPKFFKYHGNTYSHRPNSKKMLIPARPIPPPFVPIGTLGGPLGPGPLGPGPVGPMIIPSPTTLNKKSKKNKHHHHSQMNLAMEEPIYIPSSRTLSPNAVPIPDAYFTPHGSQVYATMESPRASGSKNKKDKHLQQQNGHSNGKLDKETAKLLMMRDKKFAKSMNGLDHADEPVNLTDESPFNTGIYRKKGHLNERAFSYSIRQEHRSRSYGSLANLKFATPLPNGVGNDEDTREDIKKEREIMQMVQDLDLSGDEIERSEVPRSMYENRGMPPALGGPTVIVNGSRGHRR